MKRAALTWKETFTDFGDGSYERYWIAADYKIVEYTHTEPHTRKPYKVFFCYVAIEPLKADGNPGHVNNRSVGPTHFYSLHDAQHACESHNRHGGGNDNRR